MITNLLTSALLLATNLPIGSNCEMRADGFQWCNGGIDTHAFEDCLFFEGFYDTDSYGRKICVLPYLEESPPKYLYFYHHTICDDQE